MPIPDEEANIVDTNKPINPSTIPNKEEINQNTIDKLPLTGDEVSDRLLIQKCIDDNITIFNNNSCLRSIIIYNVI